jgi:polar amino acid transport system substrate-binding protein
MRANTLKRRVVLTLFLLLCATSTHATEPLLIVTDPWAPYTFEDKGTVIGTDVDITRAVFKRLGMDVKIQILPWKRCLAMVESRTVDAILAVSVTPERQQFIHFPEEAVSEGITVFFVKNDRKINFTNLTDLNDSRAGAMLGYSYCNEVDQSAFMRRAERVDTLEQLFNMLLLGADRFSR